MFVKEFNYNEIRSNTIKFLTIYWCSIVRNNAKDKILPNKNFHRYLIIESHLSAVI